MALNQPYLLATLVIAVLLIGTLISGCIYRQKLLQSGRTAHWERGAASDLAGGSDAERPGSGFRPSLRQVEQGLWLAVTLLGVDLMAAASLLL